ncbi:hypothetical protein ACFX1S_003497 [Malus domestica]
MERVVVDYSSKLFESQGGDGMEEVLTNILLVVSEEMNEDLIRSVYDEEIKSAVFQMHSTKAPGPDGMSPRFYQNHWDVVGSDVCNGIRSMLHSGCILRKINFTHVTLILKVKDPTKMSQLRPISLCNVLYKIVAKVLTNRLKFILSQIISPTQCAFVPDQLISDNSLVVAKISHCMHKCNSGWNDVTTL